MPKINDSRILHSRLEMAHFENSRGQRARLGDQAVFIKMPFEQPDSILRFAKEAQIYCELKDLENVLVPIEIEKELQFVFPYIEKSLLDFVLKIPADRIADKILIPILSALDKIHSRCIVHGDLKLENIRISEDEKIYIADFGHARRGKIHHGNTIRSLSQHQPGDWTVGPLYDLFSVGVIAYQLTFGIHFMRDFQLRGRSFRMIPESRSIPKELLEFISISTSYDVANRFKSAQQALTYLRGEIESTEVSTCSYDLFKYFEVYLEFLKQTFAASGRSIDSFDQFVGPQGEKYYQRLAKWSESDQTTLVHLKRGNDIIGMLEAKVQESGVGIISTLFVREDQRRLGFGQFLEKHAIQFFKDNKCKSVILNVDKKNTTAIAFYQKSGWSTSEAVTYPEAVQLQRKI